MRNLKRALSLGLTAAMISGLMVMGSSAASYADVTSENNVEAIEVLEAVGIMIGDENGNFNPDQNVTRNEMAVVMSNLMEYNVASYKDTSPFTDVPSWAEPYVAACWTNGITAGYSDTIYGGSDTVTTAQAALMLMKALGYFQYASDFGSDWQLATTRQGNAIDLFDGVDSGVTQAMTRNDVAQLVLNTLRSGTVEASTDGSWSIGDVTINNNVQYSYVTSNQSYATAIDDVRSTSNTTDAGRSIVELGEQLYQGDLKLADNTIDDFGRPSRTWSYDGKEVGTYAKTELLVESYTDEVTGRDVYDLLSAATIRDSEELYCYLDGEENADIEKNDLVRSNDNALTGTGLGVLTEVYLDQDTDEITIASINTYLAKAISNYNENTESATLTVYLDDADGVTRTVDVEEVPNVVDVTEDTFYLVRMTGMDNNRLEVVELYDAEVLEDSTVTKFSKDAVTAVDKLTVDGTEYKATVKAFYDKDTLDEYDQSLLTDMSYNVYLDLYGNAIGVELYEGTMNYVFITGYDRSESNISVKTASAAAIFTDGTMDEITVNVTATNDNIDKLDGDKNNNNGDGKYYEPWSTNNSSGDYALNRWYTYTVTESGVYTLKPVGDGERMFATYLEPDANGDYEVINASNVRVDDEFYLAAGDNGRAYGNDDSVYITAESGRVDTSPNGAITEVTGVYTGVQDVEIEMNDARGDVEEDGQPVNVFTVFDSDRYIIASIVLGDAQGDTANYAYILSEAKSEEIIDGTYYWEFDAILGGEKQTLTARSEYPSTIDELVMNTVQELRFDGDYVVDVRDVDDPDDLYVTEEYNDTQKIDNEEVYDVNVDNNTAVQSGELRLVGRTLYSSDVDVGLTLVSDAKAVVRQMENGKTETTNYGSVAEAIAALGDANENAAGKQYDGRIVAVLDDRGVAEWVFFDSDTAIWTGGQGGYDDANSDRYSKGDATLYVYNNPDVYTAESVEINSRGTLAFSFGVPATWIGDTVTYSYDVYVAGELVARDSASGIVNLGGVVVGSVYARTYDVGEDVVIHVYSIDNPNETTSTVTMDITGAAVTVNGNAVVDNQTITVTKNSNVTVSAEALAGYEDSTIQITFNGIPVTTGSFVANVDGTLKVTADPTATYDIDFKTADYPSQFEFYVNNNRVYDSDNGPFDSFIDNVKAGDQVMIVDRGTGSTPTYTLNSAGRFEVADGVYGTVNATNHTLTFIMPNHDITLVAPSTFTTAMIAVHYEEGMTVESDSLAYDDPENNVVYLSTADKITVTNSDSEKGSKFAVMGAATTTSVAKAYEFGKETDGNVTSERWIRYVSQADATGVDGVADNQYYMVGSTLDIEATSATAVIEGSANFSAKDVTGTYIVPAEDFTLNAAVKVTMNDGITAKIGTNDVTGEYVAVGQNLTITVPTTAGTAAIDLAGTDNKHVAAASGVANNGTLVISNSDIELYAAVMLALNSPATAWYRVDGIQVPVNVSSYVTPGVVVYTDNTNSVTLNGNPVETSTVGGYQYFTITAEGATISVP